jgi:hypothetical protein
MSKAEILKLSYTRFGRPIQCPTLKRRLQLNRVGDSRRFNFPTVRLMTCKRAKKGLSRRKSLHNPGGELSLDGFTRVLEGGRDPRERRRGDVMHLRANRDSSSSATAALERGRTGAAEESRGILRNRGRRAKPMHGGQLLYHVAASGMAESLSST